MRGEVRFDPGSRALYATDLSAYRQGPIGVGGQRCNVAVVIDFSKHMNRLLDDDSHGRRIA